MSLRLVRLAEVIVFVLLFAGVQACGSKQPKESKEQGGEEAGPGKGKPQDAEVESAKSRIQEWLGKDLAARISDLGKNIGQKTALELTSDEEVMAKVRTLTKTVFQDPVVKKELDKISDKATSGFTKKLTLGWKALSFGGIDGYKQKVKDDAMRVAVDVLSEHLKQDILKDKRMAKLMKDVSPVFKLQSVVITASLQENISPKVTQKILKVVLKIAASNDDAKMAGRVEKWIEKCDNHAGDELEKLMVKISELKSVKDSLRGLAIDVLGHKRTSDELSAMARELVLDPEVHKSLIKVYEAAAFDKGDPVIQQAMQSTVALPIVDERVFAAMGRIAAAEGAGSLMSRNIGTAAKDPAMASMVENFAMSLLETCGDPTEDAR